jgi:hypothetical protein
MDLTQLKEAAIEATARALQEKFGVVPDEDSDEWESEYRLQFALAKQRYGVATPTVARAAGPALQLPELRGDSHELVHWGEQVRAERLREVTDAARRAWMAKTWTRAKLWVDTREVPIVTLLQRTQGQYDDYRRQQVADKQAQSAAMRQKAAAVTAYQEKLRKAGVTEEGLVEMIDAAERVKPAALGEKLVELHVPDRHLRVFATADPAALLVKEKDLKGQHDYCIERDEGLVADLQLFASAP